MVCLVVTDGTTSKLPEEIEQIPEEELAAAPVSVVKKGLCEDKEECKDLKF
jgi:hypothetical protein